MESARRKILIADDNEMNRMILCDMLADEFDLIEAANGEDAISVLERHADEIDLVLLDVVMPLKDGFEVLAYMNNKRWIDSIQVIMISAESAPTFMRRAFDLGAVDFISRPFDQMIVRRRIVNTIMLFAKQKQLTDMVAKQIKERERSTQLMITVLSHIVASRNGESGRHVKRINTVTGMLLRCLLSKSGKYYRLAGDINTICAASSFHDIGKINIPSEILNKQGALTVEEYEIMKTHTVKGEEMMNGLTEFQDEPLIRYCRQICRSHHERWDGSGYPDGLSGDDIPIIAQVVALADVYDALTSERCYKEAFSHEQAIRMILKGECGAFNPVLLDCLRDIDELLKKESDVV